MKLQINIPYSAWEYKISAVYKISFDTGKYYIGCSEHLRSRAATWSAVFKSGVCNQIGESVLHEIQLCQSASLDIIELCHITEVKDRESFYLHKFMDDPNMLSKQNNSWKPALQYTVDGKFLKKHVSVGSTARYMGSNLSRIQDVLSKKRDSHKGMFFIYEQDYQKPKRPPIRFTRERKKGRDILIIDSTGKIIKVVRKIKEAAKEIGVTPNTVAIVIANGKPTKGVTLKYA